MNVTSTTASPGTVSGSPATSATATDRLGKQDFLKLLIAQLRNQDPMKPMEDREFITQLAQFSSLETMQNLDKRLGEMASAQALGQAAGIIGKQVEAKLADGATITGPVTEVRIVAGTPRYVVNGKEIEVNQVVKLM